MSAENYRPISLLPQLSKILEKLIKVRFNSYLKTYNIISDSEYGVRANMSTSDALIDTIEFVTDALEKCDKCSIVSIAFDIIYHMIPIKKLNLYVIRDTANVIISYLNNRK